jgi:hypothetical protein
MERPYAKHSPAKAGVRGGNLCFSAPQEPDPGDLSPRSGQAPLGCFSFAGPGMQGDDKWTHHPWAHDVTMVPTLAPAAGASKPLPRNPVHVRVDGMGIQQKEPKPLGILPFQKRRWAQRMFGEPSPCQLHQPPVESCIGKLSFDPLDAALGQAPFHRSQRKIHQIAFAEHLDQRVAILPGSSELVVHVDHESDFGNPRRKTVLFQIRLCQSDRGWKVIDGAVCPDSKVMETAGEEEQSCSFGNSLSMPGTLRIPRGRAAG